MNSVRLLAGGMRAILQRDLAVFLSYRAQVVSTVISALFSVTLFYYVSKLVRVPTFPGEDDYFAFVVVGLALSQVLHSSFDLPGTVRSELLAGTIERLVVSPFGIVGSVVSMLLFPLGLALVLSGTTLIAGGVFYGLPIQWSTAALIIPVGVAGSLAFSAFGLLFAAVTLVFKQGASAATVVTLGVSLLAGFYFPVSLLPPWIEWASYVQPFTPAVDLSRNVLVGTPLRGSAWVEIGKLVGFAVILFPLAVVALSAAVGRARKSGTITEY